MLGEPSGFIKIEVCPTPLRHGQGKTSCFDDKLKVDKVTKATNKW